jgi:hypothetical protein
MPEVASTDSHTEHVSIRERWSRIGWKRSIMVPVSLLCAFRPYVVRGWEWLGEIETARFAFETVLFMKVALVTGLIWWISIAHDWSQLAVPLICFGLLSYLVAGPEPNQVRRFATWHRVLREKWHWIFGAVIILFVLPSFITVPSHRAITSSRVTKRPIPIPRPPETARGAAAAIDKLSELGWTVDHSTNETRFEITNKPLPDMEQSANYLKQLPYRFTVQLQSLSNINGLHYLAGIANLTKLSIGAGAFTDISELRTIEQLQELDISQTPLTGPGIVDAAPLASLTHLDKLVLGSTRITDIGPLASLTRLIALSLTDVPVRNLSALASLLHLKMLDIRDTEASDLSPLEHSNELETLDVGAKQVPDLPRLARLPKLKNLTVIAQSAIDLSSVGVLTLKNRIRRRIGARLAR